MDIALKIRRLGLGGERAFEDLVLGSGFQRPGNDRKALLVVLVDAV